MAKANKVTMEHAPLPEETPAEETVQNPAETEVGNESTEVTPKDETAQKPAETEDKQEEVTMGRAPLPEDEASADVQIIIVKRFRDKFDPKILYTPGRELTVDEERADDLTGRGLAKLKAL
jgi:hypothetical protein